jgi:acetyl-CoA acetyltransferase
VTAHPLRDRAAIVGVGDTGYSRSSGVSTLTLALRAIRAALDDAGLTIHDLDGVATHRVGDSVQASVVAQALGIRDLRFHLDLFGGGSQSHATIAGAAMAIATGTAECVVCWRSINARSEFRMGGTGRPPPDVVEFQYQTPYGYATPPQQFAMWSRAWMHRFGVTAEDLARVAIRQRAAAVDNPAAVMRSPITLDDYLSSRWIVEPFRLYDCCLETDAAVALVLTSAERAADLARPPVLVSAAVWGGGHTLISNGRGDLTTSAGAELAPRLWSAAGVGPSDVDVACLYDAFTSLVLLQIEDYGFCAKGDAAGWYADTALPVNPHGGHLSEGYLHGLNHAAEAVRQLRGDGDCGVRQVAGARVALSTGQPGYVAGTSSAVVLRSAA